MSYYSNDASTQIAVQLRLNRETTRVVVTSIIAIPSHIASFVGEQPSTEITVSVDYLQLSKPSSNFSSSLEERLAILSSAEALGGIAVNSDGTFGYQGFFLSGIEMVKSIMITIVDEPLLHCYNNNIQGVGLVSLAPTPIWKGSSARSSACTCDNSTVSSDHVHVLHKYCGFQVACSRACICILCM